MKTPNALMHPFTLRFLEPQMESAFVRDSLPRLRMQSRIALLVGIFVYTLFGVLDSWFVPTELQSTVWLVRFIVCCAAFAVFLYTFHPAFERYNYGPLVMAGIAPGTGMLVIMWLLPSDVIIYYYTGLVLTAFWTYNFIGTRFVYAFAADIALLLAYNILFGVMRGLPPEILASHDYVLVSANLIGGAACSYAKWNWTQNAKSTCNGPCTIRSPVCRIAIYWMTASRWPFRLRNAMNKPVSAYLSIWIILKPSMTRMATMPVIGYCAKLQPVSAKYYVIPTLFRASRVMNSLSWPTVCRPAKTPQT
jgi:hypothetical protein